ncbi:MAG TPA: hypothetical protein DCR14_09520, partial [Acidimicrobiaceae bacterium]|nr:hypothetical protein [Acidimicrobiaceae bacterium]
MRGISITRRQATSLAVVVGVAVGISPAAFASRATAPGTAQLPASAGTSSVAVVQPTVSETPTVSADGRWVAYAGAPAAGDSRGSTVYLLDRTAGVVTELSTLVEGVPVGNTVRPVISADGCTVTAITEMPFDLFRDDNEGARWDVYRTVLSHCDGSGGWDLVSATSGDGLGVAAGDNVSPLYPPAVSGEGSVVAYTRTFGPDTPDLLAVQVVDLTVPVGDPGRHQPVAGTPALAPDGTYRYRGVREPAISTDGNVLAFTSDANSALAMPEWGSASQPGDFATSHVFVWQRDNLDRNTNVRRVSNPAGPDTGHSTSPTVSGDGSTVAFVSTASNLVPGATLPPCAVECVPQVYIVELEGGSLRLASRVPGDPAAAPVGANAASTQPSLDHRGDELVFVTRASNLFAARAAGVGNGTDGDIVRTVPALGTATRVNVLPGGTTPAPAANSHPRLSANGRVVVFDTLAGSVYAAAGTPAVQGRQVAVVDATPQLGLADLDMGTVAVSFPGPEWVLNVTNNGPSSFTPGIVTIDQPDFLVSGGTCVEQRGVPVPPGGVCTVTLMFMPMVEGAQEATLTVAEMGSEVGADALKAAKAAVPNELNPVVIDPATELSAELDLPDLYQPMAVQSTLRGFGGDPSMAPSPAGAHSREAVVGNRAEPMPFTIYNVAFNPVNVRSVRVSGEHADDFEVIDDECTGTRVDASGSCQLSVVFTPTDSGRRTAIVKVTTDDGAYTTMIVSGDGHYEPRVATSAITIMAGSRVQVTGAGYAPGAVVTVAWADGLGRSVTAVADD